MMICHCGCHRLNATQEQAVNSVQTKIDELMFQLAVLNGTRHANRRPDHDAKHRAIRDKLNPLVAHKSALLHRHSTATI